MTSITRVTSVRWIVDRNLAGIKFRAINPRSGLPLRANQVFPLKSLDFASKIKLRVLTRDGNRIPNLRLVGLDIQAVAALARSIDAKKLASAHVGHSGLTDVQEQYQRARRESRETGRNIRWCLPNDHPTARVLDGLQ